MTAGSAERFIERATSFVRFMEEAGSLALPDRLRRAHQTLLALYREALDLPEVEGDDVVEQPDAVPLADWPGMGDVDGYWEVFDPYDARIDAMDNFLHKRLMLGARDLQNNCGAGGADGEGCATRTLAHEALHLAGIVGTDPIHRNLRLIAKECDMRIAAEVRGSARSVAGSRIGLWFAAAVGGICLVGVTLLAGKACRSDVAGSGLVVKERRGDPYPGPSAVGRVPEWRSGGAPPISVTGVVIHDGRLVPGATVDIRTETQELVRAPGSEGTTDSRGVFRLDGLDRVPALVVARMGMNVSSYQVDLRRSFPGDTVWIALWLRQCSQRARGRVVDATLRPVGGVGVYDRFPLWDHSTFVRIGQSDSRGRFEACGEHLMIGGAGYAVAAIGNGNVGDLVLEPAATLRGTVVDSAGKPIAGAIVGIEGPPVVSDNDGTWEATVSAGCHSISAAHEGRTPVGLNWLGEDGDAAGLTPEQGEPVKETKTCGKPGATIQVPPIVLMPCEGRVWGTVRTADGVGAPVRVTMGERQTMADTQGRFSFACPGPWPTVDGHVLDHNEPWWPGTSAIELTALPAPRISGQVIEGGRPVLGALVRIRCPKHARPSVPDDVEAFTDFDGRYDALAQPGPCQVKAEGPLGQTSSVEMIDLSIGGRTTVDIRVSRR